MIMAVIIGVLIGAVVGTIYAFKHDTPK